MHLSVRLPATSTITGSKCTPTAEEQRQKMYYIHYIYILRGKQQQQQQLRQQCSDAPKGKAGTTTTTARAAAEATTCNKIKLKVLALKSRFSYTLLSILYIRFKRIKINSFKEKGTAYDLSKSNDHARYLIEGIPSIRSLFCSKYRIIQSSLLWCTGAVLLVTVVVFLPPQERCAGNPNLHNALFLPKDRGINRGFSRFPCCTEDCR